MVPDSRSQNRRKSGVGIINLPNSRLPFPDGEERMQTLERVFERFVQFLQALQSNADSAQFTPEAKPAWCTKIQQFAEFREVMDNIDDILPRIEQSVWPSSTASDDPFKIVYLVSILERLRYDRARQQADASADGGDDSEEEEEEEEEESEEGTSIISSSPKKMRWLKQIIALSVFPVMFTMIWTTLNNSPGLGRWLTQTVAFTQRAIGKWLHLKNQLNGAVRAAIEFCGPPGIVRLMERVNATGGRSRLSVIVLATLLVPPHFRSVYIGNHSSDFDAAVQNFAPDSR